jgi:hypothetical protein
VKRLLPELGSVGAFLVFVERRGTAHRANNDMLEKVAESRASAKTDPWT